MKYVFLFLHSLDRVSFCISGYLELAVETSQSVIKFMVSLLPSSWCSDYKYEPPCLATSGYFVGRKKLPSKYILKSIEYIICLPLPPP